MNLHVKALNTKLECFIEFSLNFHSNIISMICFWWTIYLILTLNMSIYFKWNKDLDKKIEQRKMKTKIEPLLESLCVSNWLVIK